MMEVNDSEDEGNDNVPHIDENDAVQRALHGDQESLRSHGVLCKKFFDGYFAKIGWKSVEEVTEQQLLETGSRLKFIQCVQWLCEENLMYNTVDKYVSALKARITARFPHIEMEFFNQGKFYTGVRKMFFKEMTSKAKKNNKKMRNKAEKFSVEQFEWFLRFLFEKGFYEEYAIVCMDWYAAGRICENIELQTCDFECFIASHENVRCWKLDWSRIKNSRDHPMYIFVHQKSWRMCCYTAFGIYLVMSGLCSSDATLFPTYASRNHSLVQRINKLFKDFVVWFDSKKSIGKYKLEMPVEVPVGTSHSCRRSVLTSMGASNQVSLSQIEAHAGLHVEHRNLNYYMDVTFSSGSMVPRLIAGYPSAKNGGICPNFYKWFQSQGSEDLQNFLDIIKQLIPFAFRDSLHIEIKIDIIGVLIMRFNDIDTDEPTNAFIMKMKTTFDYLHIELDKVKLWSSMLKTHFLALNEFEVPLCQLSEMSQREVYDLVHDVNAHRTNQIIENQNQNNLQVMMRLDAMERKREEDINKVFAELNSLTSSKTAEQQLHPEESCLPERLEDNPSQPARKRVRQTLLNCQSTSVSNYVHVYHITPIRVCTVRCYFK